VIDADGLETRSGLPAELRLLVEKYPRQVWTQQLDIGGTGAFWLQHHAMLRQMGGLLTGIISDYREGRSTALDFAQRFAPRLQAFLGDLNGHHQVEDAHYFPLFAQVEPRLKRGFDILDADHHLIHEALERNAEAANAFLRVLHGSNSDHRRGADVYASENERLVRLLARHLDDEEDLVIPLLLDRGEGEFAG